MLRKGHYVLLSVPLYKSPPKESIHFCRAEYSKLRGARQSRRCAKPTIELVQTGPNLILKFKISTSTAWKSMGIFGFCDIFQERLPQTFCSCVAISWNFKTRLGPVWTNSMLGVTHPLPFL